MAIVNAVISLSKVFQIEVVAEGVENIEQLLMLLDLGCDSIQGYVVARPMNYKNIVVYFQNYTPDPRLKVVTHHLPRRADFELLLALSNHKYWVELVVESIRRSDFENIPQLSHTACRFGKWLKNNGKKYFSQYESFNDLLFIHKDIHKKITLIVQKHKNTEDVNKEDDIKTIYELKKSLVSIIEKLKSEYIKFEESKE